MATIIPAEASSYDLTKENFPIAHLIRGEEKMRLAQPVAWPLSPETRALCDDAKLGDAFLMELGCAIQYLSDEVRKWLRQGWSVESLDIGVATDGNKRYVKVGTWTLVEPECPVLCVGGDLVYRRTVTLELMCGKDKAVQVAKTVTYIVNPIERTTDPVHAACAHRPNVAACGANKPTQTASSVLAEITCPECKLLARGSEILASWLKNAEPVEDRMEGALREAHWRTGAYVEAFYEQGREVPPQWLYEWIFEVCVIQELFDAANRAVSILSDMADASESAAVKAAMKLAMKRIKGESA